MTRAKALQAACRKAFRQGEDPDIIGVISSYKSLSDATDDEIEAMYNYIADWTGISIDTLLTLEQDALLESGGYLE